MTENERSLKDYLPILLILSFFVVVQALALFLSGLMAKSGFQVFKDPTQISNSAIFIGLMLISAILSLILIKFGIQNLSEKSLITCSKSYNEPITPSIHSDCAYRNRKIYSESHAFRIGSKWIFKFLVYVSTMLTLYITFVILFTFIPFLTVAEYSIVSFVAAITLTVLLCMYPEWYIVDITGVCSASGIAALFGISFSIIPAIIVLVLLAIYDAISVYKTKHMITIVDAGMDSKLPLMLIAPNNLNYSFIKSGFKKEGSNETFFVGVGDVVEPTILVVSAHIFLHNAYPVIGAM
ncbi:MAG TPA: presenilin family intramembrane aspartyl protease PSH, partial [Methanosarcina sp.]|nr:presenilin family intramembrane aspartyl protease PSH [Methanosarcina sp.]